MVFSLRNGLVGALVLAVGSGLVVGGIGLIAEAREEALAGLVLLVSGIAVIAGFVVFGRAGEAPAGIRARVPGRERDGGLA